MHPAEDRRRSFGDRVRLLRVAAGLSQEELADRSGLHRTYISSVERGQRNISLANIHSIADALSIDVRELFERVS
jgi:transcriptional regulator with XRE-family HTH domain